MQKKNIYWMLTAILVICGLTAASVSMTSCEKANAQENGPKVVSTELIRTDKSWDGVELPDYLQGRPEIVGIKYEIPAGQKLGMHFHTVMNTNLCLLCMSHINTRLFSACFCTFLRFSFDIPLFLRNFATDKRQQYMLALKQKNA